MFTYAILYIFCLITDHVLTTPVAIFAQDEGHVPQVVLSNGDCNISKR
jgi:hypothetical protein